MNKRGRVNYVVEINDEGDDTIYGPYTEVQAALTAQKIERYLERNAKANDSDDILPTVSYHSISQWKTPRVIRRLPKRPPCPYCKQKLSVWTPEYGSHQTYGRCIQPDCRGGDCDFLLAESGGRWKIATATLE